jgi:hypothetical protein
MQRFYYYEPKTIEEACSLLSQFGEDAKVLAGGTDLIPRMRRGLMAPNHIVNIKMVGTPDVGQGLGLRLRKSLPRSWGCDTRMSGLTSQTRIFPQLISTELMRRE